MNSEAERESTSMKQVDFVYGCFVCTIYDGVVIVGAGSISGIPILVIICSGYNCEWTVRPVFL